MLDHHVDRTWIYLLVMVAALAASWGLLKLLPSELAPAEDRGSFQIMIDGPEGAGYDTVQQVQQVEALLAPHVGPTSRSLRANPRVPGGWGASERCTPAASASSCSRGASAARGRLKWPTRCRKNWTPSAACACARRWAVAWCAVAGSRSRSCWAALNAEIAQWRDRILLRMADNPGLVGPDSDYKETRPQMRVNIDRQRAADLGVPVTAMDRRWKP